MQAVAAEFSGCAEKFYCFLERRVLISQELENSGVRSQNSILLKNPLWPLGPGGESLAAPRGVSDASRRCKQRPSKLFARGWFFSRIRIQQAMGAKNSASLRADRCHAFFVLQPQAPDS